MMLPFYGALWRRLPVGLFSFTVQGRYTVIWNLPMVPLYSPSSLCKLTVISSLLLPTKRLENCRFRCDFAGVVTRVLRYCSFERDTELSGPRTPDRAPILQQQIRYLGPRMYSIWTRHCDETFLWRLGGSTICYVKRKDLDSCKTVRSIGYSGGQ